MTPDDVLYRQALRTFALAEGLGCCGRRRSTARSACARRSRHASATAGRSDELAFRRSLAGARERREVAVPEALRGYRVERVGVEASHRGQLQLAAVRLEHGRASRVVHGAAAASRRS